jgi:hypothetical protein
MATSIPTTLDEAIEALATLLSEEDRVTIAKMSENEVSRLYHSLGQWIRNNWNLWIGGPLLEHMKSLGFIHPDDMSSSIIREFWARMNGVPSKITEEIEEYKQFWEKNLESNGSL